MNKSQCLKIISSLKLRRISYFEAFLFEVNNSYRNTLSVTNVQGLIDRNSAESYVLVLENCCTFNESYRKLSFEKEICPSRTCLLENQFSYRLLKVYF